MFLRNLLIAVVLFSLVIVVFFSLYGDLYNNYNQEDFSRDEYLNTSYSQLNESYELAKKISDKLTNKTITGTDAYDFTIQSAWSSAKDFVGSAWGIIQDTTLKLQTAFGLPSYWVTAFLSIILIVITFTVISGILRNQW